VEKVTYLGDSMDYRLTLGDGVALRVQTDNRHRYPAGKTVRLRLPRVCCWTVTE
jgi:hypothetical protein